MKKNIIVLCCILCLACLTSCSNESKQETSIDTKLYGNFEIKNKEGEVVITIDDIKSVEVSTVTDDKSNKEYYVEIEFTDAGAIKFAEVTKANIGESLSVYVNEDLITEPIVKSAIESDCIPLIGYSSYEEAEKLMNAIRGSKNVEMNEEHISGVVKITENDGTILVESSQIKYASVESRSIGKGGSNVQVIVLYFTDEGASIMESKTEELIGQEINVVVYGELIYSEVLEETIKNGELIINTVEDYGEMLELWSKIQDGE